LRTASLLICGSAARKAAQNGHEIGMLCIQRDLIAKPPYAPVLGMKAGIKGLVRFWAFEEFPKRFDNRCVIAATRFAQT
jgi:hypothetical protein